MIWSFLENIINRLLALDVGAKKRLKFLNEKNLEINIRGNRGIKKIYCLFNDNQIQLKTQFNQPTDMLISGNTRAFLKLALSKDLHLATRLGLKFEGDPVLLETIQKLFFCLDVDWEEVLSQYTGDILAHQFGKFAHYIQKQQQELLTNTARSVSEYLQEESKLSPTYTEVVNFLNAVDKLRERIDRLNAKIEFLPLANNKSMTS